MEGAVLVGGTGDNRLILGPGAEFVGVVKGVAASTGTLELTAGSSTGALSGLGTQLKHFSAVYVDA